VPGLNAQSDSTVYPIRLLWFEASTQSNHIKLKWKTICYLSFANFQIQKSYDGANFTTINSFFADKLRCQQPFEFSDSATASSENVFYRIIVGNIDGAFYHSRIVKVPVIKSKSVHLSVYPNVITTQANVVISSPFDDNANLKVIASGGVVMRVYNYKIVKGVSNFTLDLSNLSKGTYWITYADAQRKVHTITVMKQ
jgi:hypothetical protein